MLDWFSSVSSSEVATEADLPNAKHNVHVTRALVTPLDILLALGSLKTPVSGGLDDRPYILPASKPVYFSEWREVPLGMGNSLYGAMKRSPKGFIYSQLRRAGN